MTGRIGLCIRGTGKDFGARGWINAPTEFDDLTVMPGYLIVGDGDGVVCIPRLLARQVVEASRARVDRSKNFRARARAKPRCKSMAGIER
jgi:4-hydroxy-4-methyl-2-oxoglutarate aldolase